MADRHSIRHDLGLNPAAPVVTIVAALRPEKNHEMFLEVAGRVAAKVNDARFLIVGDGPRRHSLEELAAGLGVANRVHFLGSRGDVARILAASDVFTLTSHNEANPVSILEALSTGCPVVATRVGSVPETVIHGKTGLLVEPGESAAFADCLTELIHDPLRRRRMGDAGRRRVVESWSIETMVHGYEQLIERIFCLKRGLAGSISPAHNER
jgi:glycosyltransferase involved in cell wall biosynthesis